MFAEPSIRFPLRFVIKLIAGGLVRKSGIAGPILRDIAGLIPGEHRFEVDQNGIVLSVPPRIVGDCPDGNVLLRDARLVWHQWRKIDLDLDAKILPNTPDGVAEIIERNLRVRAAIGDDDVAAMPPHQFVKREVFKMGAVGQMDILSDRAAIIGRRKGSRAPGCVSAAVGSGGGRSPQFVRPNISLKKGQPGVISDAPCFVLSGCGNQRPRRRFNAVQRKVTPAPRVMETEPMFELNAAAEAVMAEPRPRVLWFSPFSSFSSFHAFQ